MLVRAVLLIGITSVIARAELAVTYEPTEVQIGVPTEVTIGLLADPGTSFDLGGVVWDFATIGVELLDFRWESGLDGSDWYAVSDLPAPQTAWFGAQGAGPVITDAEPFPVATVTVLASVCGTATIDSNPLLVFESTTFADTMVEAGLPLTLASPYNLDAVEAEGARYLSVTAAPGDVQVALLVTSPELPCLSKYVDGDGRLTDSPVFRPADEWQTVRVGDVDIIPGTTYHVRAECGGTTEPVIVTTPSWGDVNRDGVVDLFDIFCVLDGFVGTFPYCPLYAVDLAGDVPDGLIDLFDVFAVLDAFRGRPYSGPTPCE